MRKTVLAVAAAATLATTMLTIPNRAEARWRGGAWVGAGVAAGLIGGAIIANSYRPYYGYGYYGAPYPAYYGYPTYGYPSNYGYPAYPRYYGYPAYYTYGPGDYR